MSAQMTKSNKKHGPSKTMFQRRVLTVPVAAEDWVARDNAGDLASASNLGVGTMDIAGQLLDRERGFGTSGSKVLGRLSLQDGHEVFDGEME